MSTADVGIRIVLEDSTGAGFGVLGGNLRGLSGLLLVLAHQWDSLSGGMQLAAVTAGASGVLFSAFAGAIRYSVNAAEELQFSVERVVIAMDGAGAHVDDLTSFIMQLANTSQFTSSQIADGFVALGQHAITYSDIIHTDVAQSMIDLAEATQTQTVPAANLLTSVLQMFNLKASDSAHGCRCLSLLVRSWGQLSQPDATSL